MKNKITSMIAVALLLTIISGCSFYDQLTGSGESNSNKSLGDRAVDTAVGEQKIGVPECDEVIDSLTEFANNPDDNFVVKSAKRLVVNRIREELRKSVEANGTDKVQLAKDCREFKTELDKAQGEQNQQPPK